MFILNKTPATRTDTKYRSCLFIVLEALAGSSCAEAHACLRGAMRSRLVCGVAGESQAVHVPHPKIQKANVSQQRGVQAISEAAVGACAGEENSKNQATPNQTNDPAATLSPHPTSPLEKRRSLAAPVSAAAVLAQLVTNAAQRLANTAENPLSKE